MDNIISTARLQLIPLTLDQLELALHDMNTLEASLNITIARSFITDKVRHAIQRKIEKMQKAEAAQHHWFTYWLIVIPQESVGVGMLGYKGYPDEAGATEIGYGLDPAYQGKGYMGEAVQGLVDWAFAHPFCRRITAPGVENPASMRLLEKLGAQLVAESEHDTSWEIHSKQS